MVEYTTKDASDAVDHLLGQALEAAPCISKEKIISEHNKLRSAWGSQQLFQGEPSAIRSIIHMNLMELAEIKEFEKFVVRVFDTLECAQVMAIYSTGTFTGVRVWHTDTTIYTCGNSVFHP